MNFSVSYIYEILDRYSAPLRKIKEQTRSFKKVVDAARQKVNRFGNSLVKSGRKMKEWGEAMTARVTAVGLAIAGFSLKVAADFERLEVSFGVMLKNMDKGKVLMKGLTDFAAKTPFQMKGIADATKTLLSFGVANENIISRLTMLGDIAAGANVPLKDISQIFGKIKTKGKAMTEEILQLADRGIPIMDTLAKSISEKFNISMDRARKRVFKFAERGKISFAEVKKALESMTGEGGRFKNMMELLSATLGGRFSTFLDEIQLLANEFGKTLVEVFDIKGLLEQAANWLAKIKEKLVLLRKENPELVKMIAIIGALVVALGPLLIVLGPIVMLFGFMLKAVALLTLKLIIIAAAIAFVVTMFSRWYKTNHPVIKSIKNMQKALQPLSRGFSIIIDKICSMIGVTNDAKDSTSSLAKIFDFLGFMLIPVFTAMATSVNAVFTILKALAQFLFGDFAGAIKTIKDGAKNIIQFWQDAGESMGIFKEGGTELITMFNKLISSIKAFASEAKDIFSDIGRHITSFTEKAKSTIASIGLSGMGGGFGIIGKTILQSDEAKREKDQSSTQATKLFGNISVSANQSASIDSAKIFANRGENMATIGG